MFNNNKKKKKHFDGEVTAGPMCYPPGPSTVIGCRFAAVTENKLPLMSVYFHFHITVLWKIASFTNKMPG